MTRDVSRRTFLSRTGLAAAGVAWAAQPRAGRAQTSDPVRLGLIGCGRRGSHLLRLAMDLPDVAVLAVCDVDRERSARAADVVAQARGQRPDEIDFDHLIQRADVEAVIIATPDHWHAMQLAVACVAGKDAYVETPLSHNPVDGHIMVYATRKYRRVVQALARYCRPA